jgi:hypothetical protein
MNNWRDPKSDYDELCDTLSDYHKEVHGTRLRLYVEDQSNREIVIQELEALDAHLERMKQTFEGREQLRCEGWHVPEAEPELIQRAQWLKEERDREHNTWLAEHFPEGQANDFAELDAIHFGLQR